MSPQFFKNFKREVHLKFLILFVLSALTFPAFAGTLAQERGAQFELNKASPGAMLKHQLGSRVVTNQIFIAKAKYDFAVQGGTQITGNLVGEDGKSVVLPNKAVIVDCLLDVLTDGAAGGTGTMSISSNGAGDIKGTLAAASYTGLVACVPVGTAATAIKLTADRKLTYTIATGNWTQGKIWVYVYYILGGE